MVSDDDTASGASDLGSVPPRAVSAHTSSAEAQEHGRPHVVAGSLGPHSPEPTHSHADHATQPVGHFLPADMPREEKLRIMQAEALWRSGVLKVVEIATQVDRHETLVYRWAREYHWPARANVVAVARSALNLEILRRAAQRAAPSSSPPTVAGSTDQEARQTVNLRSESPVSGVDPAAAAAIRKDVNDSFTSAPKPVPEGTIDFTAERNRRPMSDEETRKQAITEQAAADAEAARLTNEFAHAISEVVDKQRQTANELAAWGAELLADAKAHREAGKLKLAELRKTKGKKVDSTRSLNESIGQLSRLAMTMKTIIDIQWRTWQLDALAVSTPPGGSRADDPAPVLPVTAGSYEDYVHAAERNGTNLTPP